MAYATSTIDDWLWTTSQSLWQLLRLCLGDVSVATTADALGGGVFRHVVNFAETWPHRIRRLVQAGNGVSIEIPSWLGGGVGHGNTRFLCSMPFAESESEPVQGDEIETGLICFRWSSLSPDDWLAVTAVST